jgi:hypothetical protein
MKYQLPSNPSVYVDLVDDEDVRMMFDEWQEHMGIAVSPSLKLHIFVQWQLPRLAPLGGLSDSGGSVGEGAARGLGADESGLGSPCDGHFVSKDHPPTGGEACVSNGYIWSYLSCRMRLLVPI